MKKLLFVVPLILAACANELEDVASGNDEAVIPLDYAPPPPSLTVGGSCPGTVDIDIAGATPNRRVALVTGSPGSVSAIPSGSCAGTLLNLGSPRLRATRRADGSGSVSLSPTLSAGPCSSSLQVVDLDSCTVSSVEPLTGSSTGGGGTSFVVGDTSQTWTASSYFRGNAFTNRAGGTLTDFSVYLGLAAGCTVDFYVFRERAAGWVIESASSVVAPAGTGLINSGSMAPVSLIPGETYGVGVGWNCAAEYFGGAPGASTPLGDFQYNFWDNAYPGRSSTYSPPNVGSTTLIYHHVYNF